MRLIISSLSIFTFASLVACGGGGESSVESTKSTDIFPLTVGDTWTYATLDCYVVCTPGSETKSITSTTTVDGLSAHLATVSNGFTTSKEVLRKTPSDVILFPTSDNYQDVAAGPISIVRQPITSGTTWSLFEVTITDTDGTIGSAGKGVHSGKGVVTVGTEESVDTPLGKIDAIPVERRVDWSFATPDGTIQLTNFTVTVEWYAKGIGRVKVTSRSGGNTILRERSITKTLSSYKVVQPS